MPRKYIILFLIYLIICAVLILLYDHFMVYVGVGLSFLFVIQLYLAYYTHYVRLPKVEILRGQRVFAYLKSVYGSGAEIQKGYFEFHFQDRTILFRYFSDVVKNLRIDNNLILYLDISQLDPYLQKLCRIHFYCTDFDNRTWVMERVDTFFSSSTKALSRQSIKTVKRLIEEVDQYVEEKTAQSKRTID